MRRSYEFDLKNFTLLKDKVSLLPNDFNKVLFSKIFQNFNEIKPIFDNCDTGFIHNDIVLHNILVENDELV